MKSFESAIPATLEEEKVKGNVESTDGETNKRTTDENVTFLPIAPFSSQTKLPVSIVFKRTCYKCGNLGHHADECPSVERLCYNCKEPGHESSKCPNDRSSESKQCYYCKDIGHIQSECPKFQNVRKPPTSKNGKGLNNKNNNNNNPYKLLYEGQTHYNFSPIGLHPFIPSGFITEPASYYPEALAYQQPWAYHQHFRPYQHPVSPQGHLDQMGYFSPRSLKQGPNPYYFDDQHGFIPSDNISPSAYHQPNHHSQNRYTYQHIPQHLQHKSEQYSNLIQLRGYNNRASQQANSKNQTTCYSCGRPGHESKACPTALKTRR